MQGSALKDDGTQENVDTAPDSKEEGVEVPVSEDFQTFTEWRQKELEKEKEREKENEKSKQSFAKKAEMAQAQKKIIDLRLHVDHILQPPLKIDMKICLIAIANTQFYKSL